MTLRGTLALLAVFALLLAYLLVAPPPAPPSLPEPLLPVPTASVDEIVLTWPETHLQLRRTDGEWRSGTGSVVAPDAVADLLAALSTLRPTETLNPRDSIAEYGLDARATTLVASAAGSVVLSLRVGDRNPAWTGVYVQCSGSDDVIVVGALLHWELEKLRAIATR